MYLVFVSDSAATATGFSATITFNKENGGDYYETLITIILSSIKRPYTLQTLLFFYTNYIILGDDSGTDSGNSSDPDNNGNEYLYYVTNICNY